MRAAVQSTALRAGEAELGEREGGGGRRGNGEGRTVVSVKENGLMLYLVGKRRRYHGSGCAHVYVCVCFETGFCW